MFDRFTDGARRIMGLSRGHAQRLCHDFIDAEHIMLALIEEGSVLPDDPDHYKSEALKRRPPGNVMVTMGQIPFTVRAKNALEGALEYASSQEKTELGCKDLLQGVLKVWDIEPDAVVYPRKRDHYRDLWNATALIAFECAMFGLGWDLTGGGPRLWLQLPFVLVLLPFLASGPRRTSIRWRDLIIVLVLGIGAGFAWGALTVVT